MIKILYYLLFIDSKKNQECLIIEYLISYHKFIKYFSLTGNVCCRN